MRTIVVSSYRSSADLLASLLEDRKDKDEVLFVVGEKRLEQQLAKSKHKVLRGRFTDPRLFDKLELGKDDLVVIHLRQENRIGPVLRMLEKVRNGASVMALHLQPLSKNRLQPRRYPWVQFVPLGMEVRPVLKYQERLAYTRKKLIEIADVFKDAKNILILIQDDPDPDAIASALALRTIIGRKRSSAPIASFGQVTRPENIAMVKLLAIKVEQVTDHELERFDRIALVDTQPAHLGRRLPRVDLIVDHHPPQPGYEEAYRDIRCPYGSTSTIFVEYLRAAGEKISERLATALLYGVRTDTLLLERGVNEWDIAAFTYLFPLANNNTIRRIERPELPLAVLDSFARGLQNRHIVDKVIFTHLGLVKREDVIPQLAEFCLQIEGVEWSVVSGCYDGRLVMSVRNVGFIRAAGELVKEAYSAIGSAGGHRAMAKAVIPLPNLGLPESGAIPDDTLLRKVEDMFLKQLRAGSSKS